MSAPAIDLTETFRAAPRVLARELEGEAVLLALDSGRYFGLDPVGARIWALLEPGARLSEVLEVLLEEFEGERPVMAADLVALVARLEAEGLVSRDRGER